jgi:hypothetical protein
MARKGTVRRASRVVVLALFACFALAAFFFLVRVFAELLPAGQRFFTTHYSLTIVNDSPEPLRITPIGSRVLGGPRFPLPCKCDGDRIGVGQRSNFPLSPGSSFNIYGKSSDIWFTDLVVQAEDDRLCQVTLNEDLFKSEEAFDGAQPLRIHSPRLLATVSLPVHEAWKEAQSPRPFLRDVILFVVCLAAFAATNWWHKRYGYDP